MSGEEVRIAPVEPEEDTRMTIAELGRQLVSLTIIAGWLLLASPAKKKPGEPAITLAPSVKDTQEATETRQKLSPQVREFMHLPDPLQKQALEYAKNWVKANFDEVDDANTNRTKAV